MAKSKKIVLFGPGRFIRVPCVSVLDEFSAACDAPHGFFIKAHDFALVQKRRPELFIKLDGRTVPVEHLPSHAKAAFFSRKLCDSGKQSLSDSITAQVIEHEEIFKKQRGPSLKRGIEIEERRVTRRLAIPVGDQGAKLWLRAKAVAQQVLLGHNGFVALLLIRRQLADEIQQSCDVIASG